MSTSNNSFFSTSFKSAPDAKEADILILPVFGETGLDDTAKSYDKKMNGLLSYHYENTKGFEGKCQETLLISAPKDALYSSVLLVGCGCKDGACCFTGQLCGGTSWKAIAAKKPGKLIFDCRSVEDSDDFKATDFIANFLDGMQLGAYKFDKYKTSKTKTDSIDTHTAPKITVLSPKAKTIEKIHARLNAATQGTITARNFVNEPPNAKLPVLYAKEIQKIMKPLGVKTTVLDEKKMAKLGMGALLAVGQGSENPPRLVIMEWDGRKKKPAKGKSKPVALVGKGVTFDTGGISIKPAAGMEDMKLDMGGSAAVVGAMQALALRKADAHVVGIVGLVENMPDGKAYRPADVITSMSGQTIEVLNTDAEGRLVLVDALTYVQEKFDPDVIIDLATLTGAMMVALGFEYCGTFVNDNDFWSQLDQASADSGEKLWRMPLDKSYRKAMDSPIADIQNMGNSRYAGACTAAGFIERFIDEGRKWAHMDIAGTAWIKAPTPISQKGGTGFGVRVLDKFVENNYG